MNSKAAKNFLADEAAQQASLDHISLSDLERRMMYFTESDPESCRDPVSLNEAFEEKYDTAEYESKMLRLLHRAYNRLKVENAGGKLQWDEAISTLETGDHYVLLLWGRHPPTRNRKDDPGSKVVTYGGMFAVGCIFLAKLAGNPHVPVWVLVSFGALLFVLLLMTMFFLAQQACRALRRHE